MGITEFLIIVAVLILFFGVRKLPMLGKALGESVHEYKKAAKGDEIDVTETSKEATKKLEG